MLRVHFTHEDLIRVRVVPTYGPLVEAMFGLRALRVGQLGAVPEMWRRRVMRGEHRWAAPVSDVMGPELALDPGATGPAYLARRPAAEPALDPRHSDRRVR